MNRTLGTNRGTFAFTARFAVLLLIAAGTLGACKGSVHRLVTRHSHDVAPGAKLRVATFNGGISVRWIAKADAMTLAVTRTSSSNDEDLAKVDVRVTTGALAEWIEVEAVGLEPEVDVDVSLDIVLPAGTTVERINASKGPILVIDGAGTLTAKTSNGPIDIRGFKGSADLTTSNGAITFEGDAVSAATTSNGAVDLTVGSLLPAGLTAETSNGAIRLTLPVATAARVKMDMSNGGISVVGLTPTAQMLNDSDGVVTLGTGGPEVVLQTSNGGITLTGTP